MAKIAFMGAGSTVFAKNVLGDVMCREPLKDSEIVLVWTETNGVFHCSAYQPTGTGRFPKGAPCIALMVLPMEGNLEDMSFNGGDEDNELLVPRSNIIVQERKKETVQ